MSSINTVNKKNDLSLFSQKDQIFLLEVQKFFGDEAVELLPEGVKISIPNDWKEKIPYESIPHFQNLLKTYIAERKTCNQQLFENPYNLFLEYIFETYDIEYNGSENSNTITQETLSAIDTIINNPDFAEDRVTIVNKDFSIVSKDFLEVFIQAILGQIYIWEHSKKSDKRKLKKTIKQSPLHLKFFLEHVAEDTKKEKILAGKVQAMVLKTLMNNNHSHDTIT